MDLATIFLIWLAVVVIDNLAKRKKRRLPPQNSPDFDIPTLPNDPNFPGEKVPIFIESPRQVEVRQKNFEPQPRQKKISRHEVHEAQEAEELDLNLTPSTVINAFVLSEILGKPKALRRRGEKF